MSVKANWDVVRQVGAGFRLLLLISLGVMVSGAAAAGTQARQQTLVKAEYRVVKVLKDTAAEPVVVEEGTYLIDRQGRYRIDRLRGGAHTAEIVDHVRRERSALDMDRKLAVIRSADGRRSGMPTLPSGPVPVESLAPGQRQRGEPIGIKVVPGELTLEGVRFVFDIDQGGESVTLTMENWYLALSDRTQPPVMLETRFEDARSVTTHEVLSVTEVPTDERVFSVPRGFSKAR